MIINSLFNLEVFIMVFLVLRIQRKRNEHEVLYLCWNLVVQYVQCLGGLWALRVLHGRTTMSQGGAVNGCDHSFPVNNAALLIGSINN